MVHPSSSILETSGLKPLQKRASPFSEAGVEGGPGPGRASLCFGATPPINPPNRPRGCRAAPHYGSRPGAKERPRHESNCSASEPLPKNPPVRSRADSSNPASNRNDRHDAERVRIDDRDLLANDDVLVLAVLRNDRHELGREREQTHVTRYHRVDADREVGILHARARLLNDDVVSLGFLRLRELDRSRGRARRGGTGLSLLLGLGLRPTLSTLLLGSPHALTSFGALLLRGPHALAAVDALLLCRALLLGSPFFALGHARLLAFLDLSACRLLAGLTLHAFLLGALLAPLGHAGLPALLLGGGALLVRALLLGGGALLARALTHVARAGTRAALGLACLCTCEGRTRDQGRRRSRDPQCGLHASSSFFL